MAERKSVNKYYPPDWDPSKGSVNKHFGQHPLRDRARKLGQGILVIRFELPYNIWCGGCNAHVGMGVRYNAEKKKVGNYYSTPIYKFRMKCHLCDNYFEIQTDPKNHDYVILSGARRKEQRWDPKENEQVVPEDKATQKKLATDAMYKLEHGSDDKGTGKSRDVNLGQIEDHMGQWKDDYLINKLAREKFRAEKKHIKQEKEADERLLEKSSLDITLVKEEDEDVRLARLFKYNTTESFDEKQLQKRKEIELKPIFQSSSEKEKAKQPTVKDRKIALIKQKFATKTGTSKTNVFDSPAFQSRTEKQDLKQSLGVRKKTQVPSNGFAILSANSTVVPSVSCSSEGCDADLCGQSNCDKDNQSPESEEMGEVNLTVKDRVFHSPGTLGLGLVSAYSDTDGSDDT